MKIETIEISPGSHINDACEQAVELANAKQAKITFTFNDTPVAVSPGELPADVAKRWAADMEAAHQALINSPEYKERRRKEAEELERKRAAVMRETAQTEAEMRETKSPWPLTEKQLHEYIDSLVDREHDYGTCCYAMSLAATAAFNYVAGKLGVTGFQASCADLDFLRRSRHIDGPFIILKGEDALYPQYDLPAKLQGALAEWKSWMKEQAEKKLAETEHAHPNVIAHWKKLAKSA